MTALIGYSLKKMDSTLNPQLIMAWKKKGITTDLRFNPEFLSMIVIKCLEKEISMPCGSWKGRGFQAVKPDWILLIQIERRIQI